MCEVSETAHREVDSRLKQIVEKAVSSRGVELIDLIHVRSGRRQVVRLLIDKVGGVSVEECAVVSRRVSADLDMADFLEGRYTLEVSSPGIDRPLKTPADFRRKLGREVSLRITGEDPLAAGIEGTIDAVNGDSVTVGGQVVTFDRIAEGKLII